MNRESQLHGVTIIELIISMVMTAIIISTVFAVWNNMNRHIINQRRKSILHAEVKMILETLVSQLRRSPGVIAWHTNGITYISPTNDDTLSYEYTAEKLMKNELPVSILSKDAWISQFDIETVDENIENKDFTLFSLHVALSDSFQNQILLNSMVAVKEKKGHEGNDELERWNF